MSFILAIPISLLFVVGYQCLTPDGRPLLMMIAIIMAGGLAGLHND